LRFIKDKHGKIIEVGDFVRVVNIDRTMRASLQAEEKVKIKSMLNEVFQVYEIDEYEQAWIEKQWEKNSENLESHSLGLISENCVLVEKGS